jgi:hypothetical protein
VVELYDDDDGLEVEFVAASGRTQAVLTLQISDVRAVDDGDLLAVRPLRKAAGSRAVATHGLIELRSMLPPLNALCVGQRSGRPRPSGRKIPACLRGRTSRAQRRSPW